MYVSTLSLVKNHLFHGLDREAETEKLVVLKATCHSSQSCSVQGSVQNVLC